VSDFRELVSNCNLHAAVRGQLSVPSVSSAPERQGRTQALPLRLARDVETPTNSDNPQRRECEESGIAFENIARLRGFHSG
jgi:hypothetical protein